MITKPELRKHLTSMGWREDSTGNCFIGEFNNRKLRVVFKPRVFQMQEHTIGKDGYYRFKRISSGAYTKSSIKDGKIVGMDRNI